MKFPPQKNNPNKTSSVEVGPRQMKYVLVIAVLVTVSLGLWPTTADAVQTCCCAGAVNQATNSATYTTCDWSDVPSGQNCSTMGFGPPPAGTNWLNAPDAICTSAPFNLAKPPEVTTGSDGATTTDPDSVANPIGGSGLLDKVVIRVLNGLLLFLGLSAAIMIMYGGYMYIFSGGNSERIEHGKTMIIWAIIGLVIVILSASIVNFVLRVIPGRTP